MVLGMAAEELLERLGHDGSETIFPHLPEPQCRRGHHIQEIIYWMFVRGRTVTPIQLVPMIGDPSGQSRPVPVKYETAGEPCEGFDDNYRRFKNTIDRHEGVIEGVTASGKRHAVAFKRGRIYDPDGAEYGYSGENLANYGFHPDIAWVIA